jgi:RNA polymerase sigma-70 factor, ECF subfamily
MRGRRSDPEGRGEPKADAEGASTEARPNGRLHQIYEDYFDFTWRSLKRLGVPDASLDDATQEVFMIVYRRLPEFEGRAKLSTWIFRTAMNVALHARRSQARSRLEFPPDLPESVSHDGSPEERLAQADEASLVRSLLDKLDFDQRAVLILAEFEEQSPLEIAETLGIPRNTVYSRLRAARIAFASQFRLATGAHTSQRHYG